MLGELIQAWLDTGAQCPSTGAGLPTPVPAEAGLARTDRREHYGRYCVRYPTVGVAPRDGKHLQGSESMRGLKRRTPPPRG